MTMKVANSPHDGDRQKVLNAVAEHLQTLDGDNGKWLDKLPVPQTFFVIGACFYVVNQDGSCRTVTAEEYAEILEQREREERANDPQGAAIRELQEQHLRGAHFLDILRRRQDGFTARMGSYEDRMIKLAEFNLENERAIKALRDMAFQFEQELKRGGRAKTTLHEMLHRFMKWLFLLD